MTLPTSNQWHPISWIPNKFFVIRIQKFPSGKLFCLLEQDRIKWWWWWMEYFGNASTSTHSHIFIIYQFWNLMLSQLLKLYEWEFISTLFFYRFQSNRSGQYPRDNAHILISFESYILHDNSYHNEWEIIQILIFFSPKQIHKKLNLNLKSNQFNLIDFFSGYRRL